MNLSNMYPMGTLSADLQTVSMDTMANLTHSNSTNGSCPSIDNFRNQVYSTAYSMFSIFGLCGNGFALFILVKTYSQKSSFHIYMLNLAISDILFICTLPLRVVYYVNNGNWFFGDFLCRISSYAFYVNLYCSIFMMTAMSFTRFIAIVFPVMNINLVNVKKTKIVCACIWVLVTLTSVPFLLTGSYEVTIEGEKKTKCFEPPNSKNASKLLILNNVSLVLYFVIPFCTILVCYTLIIRTLLQNPMTKQQTSRKKAIRMIIIVMAAFLISFMPYHIQRTVHLYFLGGGKTCDEIIFMQKSVVITLALAASNCCFDPLLYFFSGENFRRRLSTFRKQSVTSLAPTTIKHKNSIDVDRVNNRVEDPMKDSDES